MQLIVRYGPVAAGKLTVPPEEPERRLNAPSLQAELDAAIRAMPPPSPTIDTAQMRPADPTQTIAAAVRR